MSRTSKEESAMVHLTDGLVKKRFDTDVKSAFRRLGAYLKEWMKEPNTLPTYCFEFAPDC